MVNLFLVHLYISIEYPAIYVDKNDTQFYYIVINSILKKIFSFDAIHYYI